MSNPIPLSPAANAVLDAFEHARDGEYIDGEWVVNERAMLAAALRAAADLEHQSPWPTSIEGCGARWMRDQILAIADELEGAQ